MTFKSRFIFQLFVIGHVHNVVLTLNNVVNINVGNVNSTLSNFVKASVETGNVDLTLFNVVNLYVYIQNVVSTMI